MSQADLLLEIGTEEIPAGYIPPALAQLAQNVTGFLQAADIAFEPASVESFGTPRRLALLLRGVALQQPRRTEQRLGPAVRAAFDASGQPTRAAEGFARSVGAEVADLQRVETEKGERLALQVETGGAATEDILLQADFAGCLLALGFPKTMRWIPGSNVAFARPIRWLVCLLGDKVVPVALGDVVAGRASRGHRTLAPGDVELTAAADYAPALESSFVLVRPDQRRKIIQEGAHALAQKAGGRLHESDALVEEVTFLTEHPRPVLGAYEPEMARVLPREVVITALRSHQRYFCIETAEGALVPQFITFRDGGDVGLPNVIEGNQRVLRARLEDALFYWNEDRALSSEDKLSRLDRIVWLEGFGSMGDKSRRVRDLACSLAESLGLDAPADVISRGALLCKTDLATEMIRDGKEFTKLQGEIGRAYALEAGEPEAVADVIAEHLRPRFAEDRLPRTEAAACVAVADRLDTIAGCLQAGFAPTGSQDPYALRRAAAAILRIVVERAWKLDLEVWIQAAFRAFGPKGSPEDLLAQANHLFWGRLESMLSDLPAEIVRAVLSVSSLSPVENVSAARALGRFAGGESFAMLLEGAKRCRNILVKEDRLPEEHLEAQPRARALRARAEGRWQAWQQPQGASLGFDVDALVEPAERDLYRGLRDAIPRLEEARAQDDHDVVFQVLSAWGQPIDRYFTDVLVNCPDKDLRANRLSFLEAVHYLFARFADLSRVPGSRG